MLEAETARILSVAQGRTIGDKPAIRLKEVLGADIPKGIKAHVAAEVADWLGTDIRATEHVRRLDPESAAIPQILKAFLRSLATEYVFAREEFLATLSGGVHLAGNYLCRPQETLAQFVFGEGGRVTYNELFMRLDHFADYAYLTKLIDNYVVRKGRKEITLTEFRTAVSRLDERVVREHNPRELTRLLKPLFDFILLANLDRRGTIPLLPLLAFFEDKKMFIMREYIERICVIRSKTVLSREELTAIIEDLYEDEKPKETPRTQLLVPVAQTVPPASKEKSDEEEEDLEERSASPLVEEVEDERADPGENRPEPFVDIPEKESAPVSSPDAHDTGAAPVGPSEESPQQLLPDLNAIITEHQRSRFIKKIFRKDDTYYDTIIQALNAAPTWKEASQNLDHLFQINNLDPFSGVVVEFTDAIYARYVPSNKTRP